MFCYFLPIHLLILFNLWINLWILIASLLYLSKIGVLACSGQRAGCQLHQLRRNGRRDPAQTAQQRGTGEAQADEEEEEEKGQEKEEEEQEEAERF